MAHSIHAERYVDYHFLFHYALTPFVALIPNPVLAAQIATAAFAALAVFSLDLLLAGMRVRHRWFWLLAFVLASPIFTGRLLFGRGVTLFLSIVFWFVLCLVRGRYRQAGGVAALAVWTYPGFPVLVGIAGLFWCADLVRRAGSRRLLPRWPLLLWPLAGTICALIVHPAFPAQFYGYWLEFVVHSLSPGEMEQIAEWLPPSRALLYVGLAVPGVILFAMILSARRHDALGAALLAASVFFMIAAAASMKPFEYVVPILIVYAARQSRVFFFGARRAMLGTVYVVVAAGLLFWSMPQIYRRMDLQLQLQNPTPHFATADWLAVNTPPGTLIALHWDLFPLFYFRNPGNRYLFGLNPVYSYGADPQRYQAGRRFFEPEQPAAGERPDLDLARIGARYAVLDRRDQARTLIALLDGPNPFATAVYANERFVVIQAR